MSQRQKEKEKTTREKKKRRNSLPTLSDAAPPPYPLHFGRSPFPTPKGSPTGPKGKPPRKIDEPQQERERKNRIKQVFFSPVLIGSRQQGIYPLILRHQFSLSFEL